MKNYITASVLGVVACASNMVLAGGPDHMAPPPPPATVSHVYADVLAGVGMGNWQTLSKVSPGDTYGVLKKHDRDSFSYGADVGYMLNNHLGIEMGWVQLPDHGKTDDVQANSMQFKDSWGAWLSARLQAPITQCMSAFFKFGMGYLNGKFELGTKSYRVEHYRPMFAVGAAYQVNHNWNVGLQYLRFMGEKTYTINPMPSTGLYRGIQSSMGVYALSVGYRFFV